MPGIEEYLYGKPLRIDYEELHPDSWELVFIHCNPAVEILDWEIDPNKSYILCVIRITGSRFGRVRLMMVCDIPIWNFILLGWPIIFGWFIRRISYGGML